MASNDPADWVALNLLPGLGPIHQNLLIGRFGCPREVAYRLPARVFRELRGFGSDRLTRLVRLRERLSELRTKKS